MANRKTSIRARQIRGILTDDIKYTGDAPQDNFVPVFDSTKNTFKWVEKGIGIIPVETKISSEISAPEIGDKYLVINPDSGTVFTDKENYITYFDGENWKFISPINGMHVWVRDEDRRYIYHNEEWKLDEVSDGIGQLNWVIIDDDDTADNLKGYLIDASEKDITLTLPESPNVGDVVGICDYTHSVQENTITISRNGNKIIGKEEDLIVDVPGAGFSIVYTNAVRGWEIVTEIFGVETDDFAPSPHGNDSHDPNFTEEAPINNNHYARKNGDWENIDNVVNDSHTHDNKELLDSIVYDDNFSAFLIIKPS